jgi:redox-sensitive bicupin YhaK (pirin superfamily)
VLPAGHHAFIYPFEGSVAVGPEGAQKVLATHHAGILSDGDEVEFSGGPDGGRVILLAGRPLLEPIVQYGPFVMNTREEIGQAMRDYQSGHRRIGSPNRRHVRLKTRSTWFFRHESEAC